MYVRSTYVVLHVWYVRMCVCQGYIQKFWQGGYVHKRGGGANAPPCPPLKYSPVMYSTRQIKVPGRIHKTQVVLSVSNYGRHFRALSPSPSVINQSNNIVSLKPHPWIHSTGCITSPARGERVWYTCHTLLVLVECLWSPILS